jgi:hypothetical protein
MKTIVLAGAALLLAGGVANAQMVQSGSVVSDPSYYNTSGAAQANELPPPAVQQPVAAAPMMSGSRHADTTATESTSGMLYNTYGPGALNGMNPDLHTGASHEPPMPLAPPPPGGFSATTPTDASAFNTASVGAVNGLNPGAPVTITQSRYATTTNRYPTVR